MFNVIPVIIGAVFIIVIGIILVRIIKGAAEWSNNNNSPRLTVDATVVTKREKHTRNNNIHNNMHHYSGVSTYFTTFQVESGDRVELKIPEKEYGMLAEGDIGKLTFQGTRYVNFEREKGEN
jgi:hypothetical protein